MKFIYSDLWLKAAVTLALAYFLTACSGDASPDNGETTAVDLPDGKTLVFIDANTPEHYSYDTTSDSYLNLNAMAASSSDTEVQNLAVTDAATIGSFLFWADDANADGVINGEKILLMKPSYIQYYADTIDHTKFNYLAHFHGTTLAAHASEEFDPSQANWEGSNKQLGLARLNSYVTEQQALFAEINIALLALTGTNAGQQLCQVYLDPHGGEHDHGSSAEAQLHMALTQSGRMYFFTEQDHSLQLSQEAFVALSGVSAIADCAKVTITRASADGVLVFVADSQKLYLVDAHGEDYHQHSQWDLSSFMPTGFHADFMTAIGEGADDGH